MKMQEQLMAYGRALLARVAGGEQTLDPSWVGAYLDLLTPNRPAVAVPTDPLQSVFTLITFRAQTAAPAYLLPVPLELPEPDEPLANWRLMPVDQATATTADRRALYNQFLKHGGTEQSFDRFFYLMRKYASTLPNTYGEPGVSLFEQWKMVAALVQLSDESDHPPTQLGLVSGDIPGIQRTISLVTSKGAAKAMRGRSAFIQLLGHALVQRLLDALHLGLANVVYDAGGNFLLLTGWSDDLKQKVQKVANSINQILLTGFSQGTSRFDGFHGDLSVALAAVELPLEALRVDLPLEKLPNGTEVSKWQKAEEEAKHAVDAAKLRPFGDLAQGSDQGWQDLFEPEPAETDDFCAVCRRQRRKDETFVPLDPDAPPDLAIRSNQQCPECASFNELANDLGHRGARLLTLRHMPHHTSAWQTALFAVAGRWYAIGKPEESGQETLALDMNGFPEKGVDGFRLLARTTPLLADGRIKPNDVLAEACASGLQRLGVLRMDVDDLGALLVEGLPRRTATQTAELSQTLERFFAGWLDCICRREDKSEELFYVLFAGGDDLFIIGPWTHMPQLAQAIQADFARYTAGHKAIHLSAGIAVVGEKAPLYAAADKSHDALEAAKSLDRQVLPKAKNAITFLGQTYHWAEFQKVQALQQTLFNLAQSDQLTSLLTTLLAIERRYREDLRFGRGIRGPRRTTSGQLVQVYYSSWMWRQAYAIARMKVGREENVKKELTELEDGLLDNKINDLGLAARWALWLTRQK